MSDEELMECCSSWDATELLFETSLMHARLDAYPATPGHALIIPKRHVNRLVDLSVPEIAELHALIARVCQASDADDFTIGVNDGPAAGRTIPHLHVHCIPRRLGDVADPRGGVRQVVLPAGQDPWIARRKS